MRFLRRIKGLLIHVCIICSLSLAVIHILDWYNPFMDFEGNAVFVQYILIVCSLVLGMSYIFADRKKKQEGKHYSMKAEYCNGCGRKMRK